MHPELFKVFGFPVRSYGVLLVIGVLIAAAVARRRAARFGIDPNTIWDAAVWMVIPGIFGARIVFILQNWAYYQQHRDQLLSLRFEGLTSFGGLIFGFLGFWFWQRRSKTPFWPFLDTVGVPVLIAQAVGRIGCLLNGCCYGRPTDAWYGVPVEGLPGRHVPAQLVDFVLMLVGAGVMALWEKGRNLRPGVSFGVFLVAYGISRFVYEFFRAGTLEEVHEQVASSAFVRGLPITLAQVTCLALVAIGITVSLLASRRPSPGSAALSPDQS